MTTRRLSLRGRLGDPCTLSPYDADPAKPEPAAGMFVVTEAGSAYRIEVALRVQSRIYPWRWRLGVIRVALDSIPDDAERLTLQWYPRNKTRSTP